MAADLSRYVNAAWRAVYMWRRRAILPIIDAQIADLELLLVQLLSVALPILDAEAGVPTSGGDYPELTDQWGFPRKRFRSRGPIFSRRGLPLDIAVGELRELFGMPESDLGEIVHILGQMLDEYERLRGRGCRYGLLSRGVHASVAPNVTGTQLAGDLVQGCADGCAYSLVRAAEKELAAAIDTPAADLLRLVHRQLSDAGVPDVQFRDLLLQGDLREGDLEALDILTGYPYGALGWFKPFDVPEMPSWRILSAMALGIVSNDPEQDLWQGFGADRVPWWAHILEQAAEPEDAAA